MTSVQNEKFYKPETVINNPSILSYENKIYKTVFFILRMKYTQIAPQITCTLVSGDRLAEKWEKLFTVML